MGSAGQFPVGWLSVPGYPAFRQLKFRTASQDLQSGQGRFLPKSQAVVAKKIGPVQIAFSGFIPPNYSWLFGPFCGPNIGSQS